VHVYDIVVDNFWSKMLSERYLNAQVPNGPSPLLLVRNWSIKSNLWYRAERKVGLFSHLACLVELTISLPYPEIIRRKLW